MTKTPIRFADLFRFYRGLPHQMAAVEMLGQQIPASLLNRENEWFKTWSQDGKQADRSWLQPAREIVQEFEGCKLTAYKCPAGIWTIGWGSTVLGGQPVTEGQTCTQPQADLQLELDLQQFHREVLRLLPMAAEWSANRQAALVSFTYNVGAGALSTSTLRKRLMLGQDPDLVVREEMLKWIRGDGDKPLPGLVRRRAAEVDLFTGKPPAASNPLQVPYYAQLDSTTDQARRMCFSSSCAMLLAFLRPGVITGSNGDDQYLRRVQKFGDTTSAVAQVQALNSYKINAEFVKTASFATLEQQIDRGIPVPCGYLHRGPITKPAGGGHWLIVVGYTDSTIIAHDPLGEADLIGGTTLARPGRLVSYGRANWGKRWMADGPGTGWAIIAER